MKSYRAILYAKKRARCNHLALLSIRRTIETVDFTSLHVMQTRCCDENSVRLSVCLSVKRVNCVTKRKKDQIVIPHERSFILVFWEKEWLVGATPSTWNFGSTDPRWSEIADFEQIITRSASAVTPSERSSINTNRKFTTRFPMSLRWSSYVAPKSPKGCSKTQSVQNLNNKLQ